MGAESEDIRTEDSNHKVVNEKAEGLVDETDEHVAESLERLPVDSVVSVLPWREDSPGC